MRRRRTVRVNAKGLGWKIAARVPEFVEVRDRMARLALKGGLEVSHVAEMTAFIEQLERFAIRLKIYEAGRFKGEPPRCPKIPDIIVSLLSDGDDPPPSVLHAH